MIKKILMSRDGMTSQEADLLINDAKNELNDILLFGDFSDAESICEDWFGIESDHIDELF